MADISVTVANVAAYAGSKTAEANCGASAIVQGKSIYVDPADGLAKLAKADSAGTAHCSGVSLNSASPGQPLNYLIKGGYNPGVVVTLGELYVVSGAAAGGVAPNADLGSGKYPVQIGYATTTTRIDVNIIEAGVAKA